MIFEIVATIIFNYILILITKFPLKMIIYHLPAHKSQHLSCLTPTMSYELYLVQKTLLHAKLRNSNYKV